ncbi:MAG: aminoglycoside 3'-phosphotransferase [Flavihumibacter sp.]|jgi:aminoglycoside phosphotransferase|nr:aminoglycoside 3'-phosphotransferase [Flavihumibacter sp.]
MNSNKFPRGLKLVKKLDGGSAASIFLVKDEQEQLCVLKGAAKTDDSKSLKQDFLVYEWLAGKVPVPVIHFFKEDDTIEWLCIEWIDGTTLAELPEAEQLVRIYAQALRLLHEVPLDSHAPVYSLDARLNEARIRIEKGWVDTADFEEEFSNYTTAQLWDELTKYKPTEADLVFTHGDYCPDNLIVHDGVVAAFIDMGRGGVADRYQDVALAIRSLKHESLENLIPLFLQHYGLTYLDENKLRFYTLLDEFF